MDFEKFFTAFGLPGLLVGAWYLIELAKGRRLEKEAEQKAKLEEQRLKNEHELASRRLDIEDKKASAMIMGFSSLQKMAETLDEHTRVDLEHHAKVRSDIRWLSQHLAHTHGFTPPPHDVNEIEEAAARDREEQARQSRTSTPARGVRIPRAGTAEEPWKK